MSIFPKIAFVGMTHLGLCSAVAAAEKGFQTVGIDLNGELIDRLNKNVLPIVEPSLIELMSSNRSRLNFSSDVLEIASADLIYVAPDISTDDRGNSDLSTIDALLSIVLDRARSDAVVVVLSQVPPGYTRSRQRGNRQLYYQVETLIFGRAMERATRPERFIVGCIDQTTSLPKVLDIYLGSFDCPVLPMRLESAELAKITINCCLVASVTVANTLAEICESIGADWSEIVPALKLDRRIGPYSYLAPGLVIAGGNLERDLATIIRFSEEYGTDAALIKSFISNSNYRKDWVIRKLQKVVLSHRSDARIGILGLAYKENTHSIKNSPSLALINLLKPWPVQIYDPIVKKIQSDHPALIEMQSVLDVAKDVDVIAIMTPWPEFHKIGLNEIVKVMRGKVLLDPFGVLSRHAAISAGLNYFTLGIA